MSDRSGRKRYMPSLSMIANPAASGLSLDSVSDGLTTCNFGISSSCSSVKPNAGVLSFLVSYFKLASNFKSASRYVQPTERVNRNLGNYNILLDVYFEGETAEIEVVEQGI